MSKDFGIPEENLVKAYNIEKIFHEEILSETNFSRRKELYKAIYKDVHPLYKKASDENMNSKSMFGLFLKNELFGKSILEVGCGSGRVLKYISKYYKHKELVGLDVSPIVNQTHQGIKFYQQDIVDFQLENKFEVVISSNVMEHISPLDITTHLRSIYNVLDNEGKLIINMPNRVFGPHDVTRIVDYTYTNRVPSMGTHLNESTYNECIDILKMHGFKKFYTYLPLVPIPTIFANFPKLKITPNIFIAIEKNTKLLNTLYKLKFKGKCLAKFDILLICTKT